MQEDQLAEGRRSSKQRAGGAVQRFRRSSTEQGSGHNFHLCTAPPTGSLLLLLRISIRSLSKKRAVVYSTCQLQGPLFKKFEFPTNFDQLTKHNKPM